MTERADLTISMDIPSETRAQLSRSFGPFATQEEEVAATARFAQMALGILCDWITGSKRYRTVTEQYIDWVEQVYAELLPTEEAPSIERIYNSLNMPYGQANYIARVLAAKTLVHWRTVATAELRTALEDKRKDAEAYIKEGSQGQAILIEVTQIAVHELLRVCNERRRRDRSYMIPQPGPVVAGYRKVMIPSCTIVDLIENENW